jgi:hypothetical protein
VDLAAYRQRALELLEGLRKCTSTDGFLRLRALGVLAEKLQALVEDLRSIGAANSVIDPMEKVIAELRKAKADQQPDEVQIAQVWSRVEDVLTAFVGDLLPQSAAQLIPPATPRDKFWT